MSFFKKIYWIRIFKRNFIRFRLHTLVEPFSAALLNILYLSRLSKWIHQQKNIPLNDFYFSGWDYHKRYELYNYLLKNENLSTEAINYLEFGVSKGLSFKWWIEHNKNTESLFLGFDTFTGLPEDWGSFKAGDMGTKGLFPDIEDNRARFVKGLFQDTLPGCLTEIKKEKRSVIHMDADLYTSSLYVLTSVFPYLKKDDIIIFDEFAVPKHEFKAYHDFISSYYIKLEPIVALNNFFFVAFKVK